MEWKSKLIGFKNPRFWFFNARFWFWSTRYLLKRKWKFKVLIKFWFCGGKKIKTKTKRWPFSDTLSECYGYWSFWFGQKMRDSYLFYTTTSSEFFVFQECQEIEFFVLGKQLYFTTCFLKFFLQWFTENNLLEFCK